LLLMVSTPWVVIPMGIRCVRQRRQPLGSSAPWGIAYTVEAVNRMGVTKSVNPMYTSPCY